MDPYFFCLTSSFSLLTKQFSFFYQIWSAFKKLTLIYSLLSYSILTMPQNNYTLEVKLTLQWYFNISLISKHKKLNKTMRTFFLICVYSLCRYLSENFPSNFQILNDQQCCCCSWVRYTRKTLLNLLLMSFALIKQLVILKGKKYV